MNQTPSRFKFQLGFLSFMQFTALLGLCAGIVGIPLTFITAPARSGSFSLLEEVLLVIVGLPLVGVLQGMLLGLLAFPLYTLLSARYPPTFSGRVQLERDA